MFSNTVPQLLHPHSNMLATGIVQLNMRYSSLHHLVFSNAGGAFDPLGWSKGDVEDLKVKELKNGRLAMLAFLGFVAQYGATGGFQIHIFIIVLLCLACSC